jgi:hypothetical protein
MLVAAPPAQYQEKPKVVIDHLGHFSQGLSTFLKDCPIRFNADSTSLFEGINWEEVQHNPEVLLNNESIKGGGNTKRRSSAKNPKSENETKNQPATSSNIFTIELRKSMGKQALLIKQALKKEPFTGSVPVQILVEQADGQLKKAKDTFWLPSHLVT